ncbi:hypothetical protein EMCRGX_G023822 [Ephydatia muelleri]
MFASITEFEWVNVDSIIMSHLAYPNLAKIKNFNRDLNYTGFTLEDWDDPCNLVFVFMLILCLWTGVPKTFVGLWVFFNTVIIHPMDFLIGTVGRGPKYLVDEYAILDTRYWVLDYPAVSSISYIEFFVMLPMCYLWYRALLKNQPIQHFYALIACCSQAMGAIIYGVCEFKDGFVHIPAVDWPPTFEGYLKLKYFCYNDLNRIFSEKNAEKKKK